MKIIFWSQSGNTEEMANHIAEGVNENGKEATVIHVSDIKVEDIKDESVIAFGCPAMGDEVLEEGEMEPFICEVEKIVNGKKIALFGSYGWGDGRWMRDWCERMSDAGATVINNEGLICNDAPDEEMINKCKELGKQLADLI